jgi:hypothetical protein
MPLCKITNGHDKTCVEEHYRSGDLQLGYITTSVRIIT